MTRSMMPLANPCFPPAFEPRAAGRADALEAACRAAREGAEAGCLVWADERPGLLDVAVVCEPEMALARAWPAALAAALALADALGALGPPNVPVTFGWPDRVAVNGALVGGVRAAAPEGAPPDAMPAWLVLGAGVRIRQPEGWGEPGLRPELTSLVEEGFEALEPAALAEAFARHLLFWLDRWGAAPEEVARRWAARRAEGDGGGAFDPASGDLLGLGGRRTLAQALRSPGWTLREASAERAGRHP